MLFRSVPVNSVTMAAGNFDPQDVPPAVMDRFNHFAIQNKDRNYADGRSTIGTLKHTLNAGLTYVGDLYAERIRCMQSLISKAGLMIFCKILPEIDLTVANIIFPEMLERAQQRGLRNTHNIRHYERLLMKVKSLCLIDAVDLVFNSPLSRLTDRKWDLGTHMWELRKHLYVKLEHCTIAAGMLEHQYESEVMPLIIQTFKTHIFKEQYALFAKQCTTYPELKNQPYLVQLRTFTLQYKITVPGLRPGSNVNSKDQADMLLNRFIYLVTDNMKGRIINVNEIRTIIKSMMEQVVKVSFKGSINGTNIEDSQEIPALSIDSNGNVQVAIKLLFDDQFGVLKSCLQEVLCHRYATPRRLLYGRVSEKENNQPFEWSYIDVKPNPNGPVITSINPNFFASGLRVFVMNSVKGVHRNAFQKHKDLMEKDIFELHDKIVIEECIEKWAGIKHCFNIGMSKKSLATLPHHDPVMNQKLEIEYYAKKGSSLTTFDELAKTWDTKAIKKRVEKQHTAHKKKYTASYQIKQWMRAMCGKKNYKKEGAKRRRHEDDDDSDDMPDLEEDEEVDIEEELTQKEIQDSARQEIEELSMFDSDSEDDEVDSSVFADEGEDMEDEVQPGEPDFELEKQLRIQREIEAIDDADYSFLNEVPMHSGRASAY